jgi:hypothetical protein
MHTHKKVSKFVKTKSLNNTMHTLRKIRRGMRETETGGGGGEEVTKDHEGMLIPENYKNVHNGHGHGACFVGETP